MSQPTVSIQTTNGPVKVPVRHTREGRRIVTRLANGIRVVL